MNSPVRNYLSLVKFSHTIFAMPFALIGFFLAVQHGYTFSWKLFVFVLLCMIFARSAAMAFNRWIDSDIDAKNPRTANREIPKGIISANNVLFFVLFNAAAFIITAFFINQLCFFLSPVALLVTLGYSATKRFTALSHFVLGLGLSLAPVGAYLAVADEFNLIPVLLSLTVLCWVSGFDIIYALQDEEFDKQQKLFSVPAWLGKKNALMLSTFIHLLCIPLLILIGVDGHFAIFYWAGATIFILLLIYQHLLVKPNDLSKVNLAFFTLNGIASILFASFVLIDLWK